MILLHYHLNMFKNFLWQSDNLFKFIIFSTSQYVFDISFDNYTIEFYAKYSDKYWNVIETVIVSRRNAIQWLRFEWYDYKLQYLFNFFFCFYLFNIKN